MPRARSNNTMTMSIKMPRSWVEDADACAMRMQQGELATVTRTDVFRSALRRGLNAILEKQKKKSGHRMVSVPDDVLDGSRQAPADSLYPRFEQLANFILEMDDKITTSVQDLSDEEVLRLAEICDKASQPGEDPFGQSTKNFSVPEWAVIATRLRYVIAHRELYSAAKAYMTRTGETLYCPMCGGACKPKHFEERKP
jgi:hypothetical protein